MRFKIVSKIARFCHNVRIVDHIAKPVTYTTVFELSKMYNSKQKFANALKFLSQLEYIIMDICAKLYAPRKFIYSISGKTTVAYVNGKI